MRFILVNRGVSSVIHFEIYATFIHVHILTCNLFKFSVPKEIKVINKERKYNHYRLSAFCLSKTLSEIPLAVIQPFAYLSVIYWVANLNSVTAFFASLGVLMADVLAAQVSFILFL